MGQAESAEAQLPEGEQSRPSALVVVGPSGVGKGTLIKRLMDGDDKFGFSCSHTTRKPRDGEQDGQHYHFTTKEEFEAGIAAGAFLEHAHVHSNIYGTSLQAVRDVADADKCCVLDIDVQGARQVRKSGLPAIFVFVAPPTLASLEARLRGRATETEAQVATRLATSRQELASLEEAGLYDYLLVNDDVDRAAAELAVIARRAVAGETGGPGSSDPGGLAATPGFAEWARGALGGQAGNEEGGERGGAEAAEAQQTAQAQQAAAEAAPPPGLERWRGRTVIVTGAASGIGWALALALARAGVRVVAVARRKARLEALQAEAVAAGVDAAEFLPVVCDITKEAEVAALPRIAAKRWPGSGLDAVVNSAGVVRADGGLLSGSTAAWVEMASTNVLGAAMVTREVVQDLVRRGAGGHVVNVTCLEALGGGALEADAGGGFYAATKAALRVMGEALRQEARAAGLPLRVSSVCPGVVETQLEVTRHGGALDSAHARYRQGEVLQPGDVVAAVLWVLAAPEHVDVSEVVVRSVGQAQ